MTGSILQKIFIVFIITAMTLLIIYQRDDSNSLTVVHHGDDTMEELKDLEHFDINSTEDIIWIVETSEARFVSSLQLCGLESVARNNPGSLVIFGFITQHIIRSDRLELILSQYHNIIILHINLNHLFSPHSPLHHLWSSGRVNSSRWPVSHTSDLVR